MVQNQNLVQYLDSFKLPPEVKLETIQFKDVWPDPNASRSLSIFPLNQLMSCVVQAIMYLSLNSPQEIFIHLIYYRRALFLPIRFYSGMWVFLHFWSFVSIQTSGEHPYQQLQWTLSSAMVQGQHLEIPSRRDFRDAGILWKWGSILATSEDGRRCVRITV